MLIYAVLAVPLAAGAAAAVLPWRRWVGWAAAAANGAVLVLGIVLAAQATRRHLPVAAGGVLRADAPQRVHGRRHRRDRRPRLLRSQSAT